MRSEIIRQLEKEIIGWQQLRRPAAALMNGLPAEINQAFPGQRFPTGAVHEFMLESEQQTAATIGFITATLSGLETTGSAIAWVDMRRNVFPGALQSFGIDPCKIFFIHPTRQRDLQWTVEELMKCAGLAAVVANMPLNFMSSRRLQLAVEQSRVTGFVMHATPRRAATTASVASWRVRSIGSELEDGLPGVGFPQWQVDLLKVRNGVPGSWQIRWQNGVFKLMKQAVSQRSPLIKTA